MAISSNATGSLGGVGLAGLALGILQAKGYIAALSTATGLPQDIVLTTTATLLTAALNYAVTHWAEARFLNSLIPSVDRTYPTDKNAPVSPAKGQDNANINKG